MSTQDQLLQQIDKAISRAQSESFHDDGDTSFRDLNDLLDHVEANFIVERKYIKPMPEDLIAKSKEFMRRMEIFKKKVDGKGLTRKERDKLLFGG